MIHYHEIPFKAVGKTRKLHVYLPDDYGRTYESYPVMYFFDGHNLFFDHQATYGKSWGLYDFMQNWSKPMIIVGLECGHDGTERLNEYCPYDTVSPYFGQIHGLGKTTMDWIVNEVKPFIDNVYRTYPFRETTGIAGSSMGGLMAAYAVGQYNHIFSKAACVSSAIQLCMPPLVNDLSHATISPDTRVFMSWGTEEASRDSDNIWETSTAKANFHIESFFQNQAAQTYMFCQEHGHHTEADWAQQVPLFMDFLWMK